MTDIESWIDDWHKIFPPDKYVITDGYLRGNSKDCVNKMKKFCKEHATYTKDVIFAATRMYVVGKKPDFAYIKRPIYFIHKLGEGSMLDAYCDKVINGKTQPTVVEYEPSNEFL